MITTTLESAPRITDALASVPDLRDVLSPEVIVSHVGTTTAHAGWEMLTRGARFSVREVDADAGFIAMNVEAPPAGSPPGSCESERWCLDIHISGPAMEDIAASCSCTGPVPVATCAHVAAVGFHLLGYPDSAAPPPSATGRAATAFSAGRFEEYVDCALANAAVDTAAGLPSARFYDFAIFAAADSLARVVFAAERLSSNRLEAFLALARLAAEYEPNVTRRFGETFGHATSMGRLAAIYDRTVKPAQDIYVHANDDVSTERRSEVEELMAERNVRAVMAFSRSSIDRAKARTWVGALSCVADKARPHLVAYAAHRHAALDQHRTVTFHNVRTGAAFRRADLAAQIIAAL